MIFDALYDSSKRGELLLVEGGMCHWHLRRDGQLTIREIISTQRGAGGRMLHILKKTPGATSILAKCPAYLDSNEWYRRRGFELTEKQKTKSGMDLNVWVLRL